MRQNGVRSNVRFPYSKGKSAKRKKFSQGYAAREDESLRYENWYQNLLSHNLSKIVEMNLTVHGEKERLAKLTYRNLLWESRSSIKRLWVKHL